MKNLLLAVLVVSLPCAVSAADRSMPGEGAGVVPSVALPQAALPGLPGAALVAPVAPSLPALPSAAVPGAAAAAVVPGAAAAVPAAAASEGGAAAPKTPAAQPQLQKLDAALQGAQNGPDRSLGSGRSAAASVGQALSSAFDGARVEHACAHCDHLVEDQPADDSAFPQDAQGNPFIVPGHLDPLLPSHVDPKTWTNQITLHLHSIFSDGTMTPEAVMDLAYAKGVRTVALSDHDTTAGLMRAWKHAQQLGMEFHPAVEMTARGGVHIGAVDLDISNPKLVALLERVRVMRYAKAKGMVDNLNNLPELKAKGITLTIDEVEAKSMYAAGGTIEIPHIARVLLDKGLIQNVDDAYNTYLKGDVFKVPGVEEDPTVEEVLETIRAAGGKAFLNHPYTVRAATPKAQDAAIEAILDQGVDGIEVYRPSHATSDNGKRMADERAAKYLTWADQRNLLAGNGADFHGTDTHLDTLVVWMPKVLAAQLTGALKDANARALAVLERLDGQDVAASKPAIPPAPGKLSALALAPLAYVSGTQSQFPWLALIPAGLLLLLAVLGTAPWFKALEKKSRLASDVLLAVVAIGFAASIYGMLLAKVSGRL